MLKFIQNNREITALLAVVLLFDRQRASWLGNCHYAVWL